MENFETAIEVRWADCDANRHVRHSAYYDYGAHARMRFFSAMGYDTGKFQKMQLGPILFKEECSFIRELRMEDSIRINLLKQEIAPDGSRWVLHHEIFNQKNEKCAHITIKGAWMDLKARKLTIPPPELLEAIQYLKQGEYYTYKKG